MGGVPNIMRNFFANPEIKQLNLYFIGITAVLISICLGFTYYSLNRLNSLYITQNQGIYYRLSQSTTSTSPEIASSFTKGVSAEEATAGEKLLKPYGYVQGISFKLNPVLSQSYGGLMLSVVFLVIFTCFITYLFMLYQYKGLFNKLEKLSIASNELMNGNFNINLSTLCEGQIDILNNNLNRIANIFKSHMESLKSEKLFLKNLIHDISHQLKTPLASLIMFNELFEKNLVTEDSRENIIKEQSVQLSRMEWLILNLLKLARIEAGSVSFDKVPKSLSLTLNNAVAPFLLKAKEENVDIILPKSDFIFPHDSNWTCEAISNLVKNALEHTKKYTHCKASDESTASDNHSKIEISFSNTTLFTTITVRDNGEGIAAEDLPHIFERFYKKNLDKSTTNIGIGLSLVKAIVEGQGGSISVESEKGKYTCFTISFLNPI